MLSLVTEGTAVQHTPDKRLKTTDNRFETFEHLSLEELKNLREKEPNPTKRKKLQIEIINRLIRDKTSLVKVLGTIVAEYVPPVVKLTERERLLLDIQYNIIFENMKRILLEKTIYCPVVENEETYDGVFIEFIDDHTHKYEDYTHKYYGPLGCFTDFSGKYSSNPNIRTDNAQRIIFIPSKFPNSTLCEVIRYYGKEVSSSIELEKGEIRVFLINDEIQKIVDTYRRLQKNKISQEEADAKWEIFTRNNPLFVSE